MHKAITSGMLDVMRREDTKEAKPKFTLSLEDGTTRERDYLDLVVNPVNQPSFTGALFVKFVVNKPERGLIVYLPLEQVVNIEWHDLQEVIMSEDKLVYIVVDNDVSVPFTMKELTKMMTAEELGKLLSGEPIKWANQYGNIYNLKKVEAK